MRFGLTGEQQDFSKALDSFLENADVPSIAREWADGKPERGLGAWASLADLGVAGLAIPEDCGGLGAAVSDIAAAFQRLGFHAVPGPWVETAVAAPALLAAAGDPRTLLPGIAAGQVVVSLAAPPIVPAGLDADVATHCLMVADGRLSEAEPGTRLESVDPARRLFRLASGPVLADVDPRNALDRAALACAAQLLGCGERMLADTVGYAKVRKQFGRAVGEYQAVKHLLADVRVALDFAGPLVHGAALALDESSVTAGRDVSAAKVAASDAAYLAARVALQIHGAIGYTREYDLSLWFTKTRALIGAWGTPSWHRARIMANLEGDSCASR